MPEKACEICLIAPTEGLAARARAMIQARGLPISVYTAVLETAVALAEQLIAQGTWLFISRRGTRLLLEQQLHTSVVNIPLEISDYIPVIQQVRDAKGLVAFFTFEEESKELETICYLLHIQMRQYCFSDNESCRKCVQQAVEDGAVWGIGGVVAEEFAKVQGLSFLLVENSDHSIQEALTNALQIYHLQLESMRKKEQLEIQLERYRNILNYTHDAIIAVDAQGRVEVTNQVAERMMDPRKRPFEGRPIEEVLPNTHIRAVLRSGKAETDQMMNIHNTTVSTNRIPIIVNNEVKGVVATFQDIHALQNTERSIRIKLHEKGLAAKYRFSDIIGESQAVKNVKELAENFADSQFTVMLYGETGTGKEMFAQSIHNASPRRDGPFVAVNCMAFSKSLLESELFGYADSSFTGAKRGGKPGLFELAHGGTIFLDEIGELPMEFQAQFLRVLQEKEVRRVGGDSVIPVDIRVIGATNSNLLERVEAGTFRQDLYYRLNVLNLHIPALREREDDFLQIADSIHESLFPDRTESQRAVVYHILEHYRGYDWPGNVRELNNVVERICLLAMRGFTEKRILQALEEMRPSSGMWNASEDRRLPDSSKTEKPEDSLDSVEEAYIRAALQRNDGNISATARDLHISRSTLYRKLRRKTN